MLNGVSCYLLIVVSCYLLIVSKYKR